MHSHFNICVAIAALGVLAGGLRPARGDDAEKKAANEPTPQQGRKAIERGLTFLVKDAATWRKERGCATCHHGTMTVWALSEAKIQGYDVDARALADVMQWTKDRFGPRSGPPGPGTASVPLIYLGMMSQNLPVLSRDEINRIARNLVARQAEDGAWESPPPKNGPPPTWESRETLALLALLAWERYVPADAKEAAAAQASRDKAEAWLSQTKSSDSTQALSLRLLLDARRGTAEQQRQLGTDHLLKRQNADGGWSQTADMPSDAYATGQALYALSFADVKNDRPEIQRAVSFLAASQREDGSWPMASRGHPGVEPYTYQVPITYFGAAWATLGLARFIPAGPETAAKQQRALDEILRFHGKYSRDEKSPGQPVTVVDLRYYDLNDQELASFTDVLQAFPQLRALQLKSRKITDAGVAHLRSLPRLQVVVLEEAAITDTGLAHLKALTQLQELSLKGTQVTETGIRELQKAQPKVKVER